MVIVAFKPGEKEISKYEELDQYDYGQILRIQGLNLPPAVEIHFALQKTGGTSKKRIGITKDGVTDVPIPDSMLENEDETKDYDIYAFIYITDETSGQTEYRITLKVKARPKPEAFDRPEDAEIFKEAIKAVNESAARSAESEKQAEGWAHGREDLPERTQDNAKYYSDQAREDSVKTDADRKEVGRLVESVSGIGEQVEKVESLTKQAQTSATNAALSEQAAKESENNAAQARAGAAQQTANDAADKALLAQKVAEEAKGNATTAKQTADAAAQAAAKAQSTADQAVSNAVTAQATAQEAAQKALAAQNASDEAAKKAEAAQTDLDAAKQNLADVTSKVDATAEEVEAAQAAVTKAQEAANKANAEAAVAQATADKAKTDAATAQSAADKATAAADEAQKQAEAAKAAADKAQADANALAVRVTEAETDIRQNAEEIKLRATKKEVTQTLGGYYTKKETDAAIKVQSDSITQNVKQQIDSIEVGGRNLLIGTKNSVSKTGTGVANEATKEYKYSDYGKEILHNGTQKEITISFDWKTSDAITGTIEVQSCFSNWNSFGITELSEIKQSGHVVTTVKIPEDWNGSENTGMRFRLNSVTGTVDFSNLKLEIGNKATDWSPSPEDMATSEDAQNAQYAADEAKEKAKDASDLAKKNENRLTISESTIKQLSDSICTMVKDKNGSTVLTQNSSGWQFDLSAVEKNLNNTANEMNKIAGTVTEVDSAIKNLNQTVQDLGKKTAYIVMTTDENGAPCIELGKEDNPFKVRITNTSVDFLEGSSRIAYVNNKALYIEKAIIKNELQIGEGKGFVWQIRANGNMGLRKIG